MLHPIDYYNELYKENSIIQINPLLPELIRSRLSFNGIYRIISVWTMDEDYDRIKEYNDDIGDRTSLFKGEGPEEEITRFYYGNELHLEDENEEDDRSAGNIISEVQYEDWSQWLINHYAKRMAVVYSQASSMSQVRDVQQSKLKELKALKNLIGEPLFVPFVQHVIQHEELKTPVTLPNI